MKKIKRIAVWLTALWLLCCGAAQAERITAEEGFARAREVAWALWRVDTEQEGYSLWRMVGEDGETEDSLVFWLETPTGEPIHFRLDAWTGDLIDYTDHRNPSAEANEAYMQLRAEWEEARGQPWELWSLEDQYALYQTDEAQRVQMYMFESILPDETDVDVQTAVETATRAVLDRYGLTEAELDALVRTCWTFVEPQNGRCYYISWYDSLGNDAVVGMMYMAYVKMETGEVVDLLGPGEGNG